MSRIDNLHILTRRLIILTGITLLIFAGLFGIAFFFNERLMLTWVVFICGIIGGFVSIQQRVPKIGDEELSLLCGSWFQVLLIPIFGAVFALVLYSILLSGLLDSDIFPRFAFPAPASDGPDAAFVQRILRETYPASGPDLAKLVFWSFAAGFAERLVPQIISNLTSKSG